MQRLRILYEDESILAIEKAAGVPVHRSMHRDRITALQIMKAQTGKWLFPVHRLDRATSGVLLFAYSSDAARMLQEQFKNREIKKTYVALIRGWARDEECIDYPLKKENGNSVDAITTYQTLCRFELPYASAKHETSRYSLLKVEPQTGRFHQIRRHLKHLSHPIVGDTVYGDGKHNQLFRTLTKDRGLYLKAYSLEFVHPVTKQKIKLRSRWNGFWQRAFDVAGVCPYLS